MEKDRENKNINSKIVTVNFKTVKQNTNKQSSKIIGNQSNPITEKLFKLTHNELVKNKDNYKSFSKFKPDDLN